MARGWFGWELLRYGIVGLVSNGIAYGTYITITLCGITPEISAACIYLVGASISYLGNYRWTFDSRTPHAFVLPKFVAAHVLGFSVQLLVITYLYRKAGFAHQLAQLVAVGCVAIILFLSFKFFVYPKHNSFSSRGS